MTIQYSSDTKRAYEDYLKQYDADKSGVSDWTEYLTNLQLGVKDQTTAYQKSAYKDISQAYRNYFLQSASLANKGLSGGLVNQLDEQLYGSFADTRANIQNTTANKILDLFDTYNSTVSDANKAISSQANDLRSITEAALDWYEQVGKDKRVLDDNLNETDQLAYQSLVDLYDQNKGELWKNVSDDVMAPKYELSTLGHAVIDSAFADKDFAEYLKNYSDTDDLRDKFLDNKGLLYDALGVGKHDFSKDLTNATLTKKVKELGFTSDMEIQSVLDRYKGTPEELTKDKIKDLLKIEQEENREQALKENPQYKYLGRYNVGGSGNIGYKIQTSAGIYAYYDNDKVTFPMFTTDAQDAFKKRLDAIKPQEGRVYNVENSKGEIGQYIWKNGSWYKVSYNASLNK